MNSLGAGGNFNAGGSGPSDAIAYPNLQQVFGANAASEIETIQSSLASWASSQANNALSASALQEIFEVQANLIVNASGTRTPCFACCINLPFTQPRLLSYFMIQGILRTL